MPRAPASHHAICRCSAIIRMSNLVYVKFRLVHKMPLVLLERNVAQQDKDVISADLVVAIKVIPRKNIKIMLVYAPK